jgi:hypothetical protein
MIWDLIGLIALGGFGYLMVTRLLWPQFAVPWFGRNRRQTALERANVMLDDATLDDEARSRLVMCRNTLRAYDAHQRELWSPKLPIGDIVKEIDELWERHQASRT